MTEEIRDFELLQGIIATFKAQHDILTIDYYTGVSGLTKEQFDQEHGQIWQDLDNELVASGFKQLPGPALDVGKELLRLKVRIDKLEKLQ